ncbi:MAG: hypothetical protein KGJ88_10005 [Verrucomicrobiota bacterium]|nr:hypothetical protein [Verrucomicrobiota bacterium]
MGEIAFIKFPSVFVGFQEVLGEVFFVPLDDELQFGHVLGPAEAIEKFGAGELGFIQGGLGITGTEVKMPDGAPGKQGDRGRHHEHAEVPGVIIEVVKGIIIKGERPAFQVQRGKADFAARFGVGKNQEMGDDGGGEQGVQPLKRHHVLAELDVGVGFEELAAFGGVIVLGAREQFDPNAFALAQNAAVFGGGDKGGQVDPDLTAEIKAVQLAG